MQQEEMKREEEHDRSDQRLARRGTVQFGGVMNDNPEERLFGLPSRQQIVQKISDQSEPPNAKTFTLVGLDLFFSSFRSEKAMLKAFTARLSSLWVSNLNYMIRVSLGIRWSWAH